MGSRPFVNPDIYIGGPKKKVGEASKKAAPKKYQATDADKDRIKRSVKRT